MYVSYFCGVLLKTKSLESRFLCVRFVEVVRALFDVVLASHYERPTPRIRQAVMEALQHRSCFAWLVAHRCVCVHHLRPCQQNQVWFRLVRPWRTCLCRPGNHFSRRGHLTEHRRARAVLRAVPVHATQHGYVHRQNRQRRHRQLCPPNLGSHCACRNWNLGSFTRRSNNTDCRHGQRCQQR